MNYHLILNTTIGCWNCSKTYVREVLSRYKDKPVNYNQLFKLNPNMLFTQGNYPSLSGAINFFATPTSMTMSSFRLKNGMRLNTYGEYNFKGERQIRPSALPWQRNNFKGAFELKSANGNFGVRVEVSRGRY